MYLETFGKILSFGFGDRITIGIILGFLSDVTPARVKKYISDDIEIAYWMSDDDWNKYRNISKNTNIVALPANDIIEGLRKYRADLLGVIINTEGGKEWLDKQIDLLKDKLGLG